MLQDDAEQEVDGYLRRKYTTAIRDIETVSREDLDLKNHLSGLQRKLLKVPPSLSDNLSRLLLNALLKACCGRHAIWRGDCRPGLLVDVLSAASASDW